MDIEKINPEFLKVEFVIYYMQTIFQPQTIIYTPETGVEARNQTQSRDIKKLQFEDGYLGDLPPDVEDGRLSVLLEGTISINTAREIISHIQKICSDVARENPETDPDALLQFYVGARAVYLLKDEPISCFFAPYITKKPVSAAFMELLGSRITEELSRFKLERPSLMGVNLLSHDLMPEYWMLNFSFSGELMRHQFVAIQKEILKTANEFGGVIEVDPNDFELSYKYSGVVAKSSLVSASLFMQKDEREKCDLFLSILTKKMESVFPPL